MVREVEIREYKKVNLREGTLFIGIPVSGILNLMLANYYIRSFNLDSIASINSDYFPPVTFIFKGKPKFPARIHADEKLKFAVITAEFTPNPRLTRMIGKTICEWAEKNDIHNVVSVEELLVSDTSSELGVYGIGSTDEARNALKEKGINYFEYGMLVGLSAVILDECRWANIDAYCLVAEISQREPSFKIVTKVLEAINKLFPNIALDPQPLLKEAEMLENQIKELKERIKPIETQPSMLFYG
ncbi:MAG: PAC2 family protein [Thermoproteota archaeon]|jgi:uncharacterized protein|nr:PAC2 family protein [Thermoproteota archaeon]